MIRQIVIFILVLLLTSCGDRPRCTAYHYHGTFPAAYHDAADYAVAHWNRMSGGSLRIEAGDPEQPICAFRAITKDSWEYLSFKSEIGEDFLAVHTQNLGEIIIVFPDYWAKADPWCATREQDCARSILMHEIGHEFFLEHLKDPKSVMQVDSGVKVQDYNESDYKECLRVGSCSAARAVNLISLP